jgi:hypothetical protein
MDRFTFFVRQISAERRQRLGDWNEVESELRRAEERGIDRAYAATLIVGLRACEREKDDPMREELVRDARSLANFKKTGQGKRQAQAELRDLSTRPINERQTLLAYGFSRACEKSSLSKRDFTILAKPIAWSIDVSKPDAESGQELGERVYRLFRARFRRLRDKEGNAMAPEAMRLFDLVYDIAN